MTEGPKLADTVSMVTSEPVISPSFGTPQNPSTFSHCCVPYLEPLKEKKYETLGKFEENFKFKREINNNSEFHYPLNGSKPFPEISKEKDFRFVHMNNAEETKFSSETFSSYHDNPYGGEYNNYPPFSTPEHCCPPSNFKQYPYDNSRTNLPNNGFANAVKDNYFNNLYDNCYPYSNYPEKLPDMGGHLPATDSSPCERYISDISGSRTNWKFPGRPNSLCPSVSDSSHFYPQETYSSARRCFNDSQEHSSGNFSKPYLNRDRGKDKVFSSTYPTRSKRSTFVASIRVNRDFSGTSSSVSAKRNTYSMTVNKLRKAENAIPCPGNNFKSKEDSKSFQQQALRKQCQQASLDSCSRNTNAFSNCSYIKKRGESSDTVPDSNSADKGANATSRNLRSGENKSPEITNSLWKQVDDVIEEILNLEEGLEAGNNLKNCDSQSSLQQSQGDNVPGTICDLLGLNGFMGGKTSASCPSEVPKVKTESPSSSDPQVVAFMKDRQKKDNHNMIERRRRFNINDRIRDLSQLLPKNNEPYHEIVRDIRHNKGQILRASVDYIRRLKSDLEVSKAAEDKRRALEQQNRQLLLRIQELENQLRMNGIKVEETKIDSNLLLPSITQTEVMSPTSTTVSPTTSPFTPTPTTSPFTPIPNHTTSPPLNPVNATNFNTTTCSSGSDLTDFNLCEEPSMTSADTSNLLSDLGVTDPNDTKKVKCQGTHLPDFLLEDLLMDDFPTENFGLNLMDDDSLAFTSDPMFSSPQVSSPNSSRHSFEDALTPDSMDIVS